MLLKCSGLRKLNVVPAIVTVDFRFCKNFFCLFRSSTSKKVSIPQQACVVVYILKSLVADDVYSEYIFTSNMVGSGCPIRNFCNTSAAFVGASTNTGSLVTVILQIHVFSNTSHWPPPQKLSTDGY